MTDKKNDKRFFSEFTELSLLLSSRTDMKRVGTRNCCSRHFRKLIRFFWKSPSSLRRIGFKYSLIDLIVLFLQNFHFLSHFYKFFLLLEAEDLQVFFLLARFFCKQFLKELHFEFFWLFVICKCDAFPEIRKLFVEISRWKTYRKWVPARGVLRSSGTCAAPALMIWGEVLQVWVWSVD